MGCAAVVFHCSLVAVVQQGVVLFWVVGTLLFFSHPFDSIAALWLPLCWRISLVHRLRMARMGTVWRRVQWRVRWRVRRRVRRRAWTAVRTAVVFFGGALLPYFSFPFDSIDALWLLWYWTPPLEKLQLSLTLVQHLHC